jgi:hypothetical protein
MFAQRVIRLMRSSTANDNLHSHVLVIARSPATCWQAFTDVSLLVAWVPGLRRAEVVARWPDGMAREASFELSSMTYSLVYDYDLGALEVTWIPRTGARDAVRGYARFDACDGGTLMTYALELGAARKPPDTALEDAAVLVAAFKRFVEAGRPSSVSLRPSDAHDPVDQVNADDEKRQTGREAGEDVRRPVHAEVNAG